jgi:hypothetical protein
MVLRHCTHERLGPVLPAIDGQPTLRLGVGGFTAPGLRDVVVSYAGAGLEVITAHELGHQLALGEEYCEPERPFPCPFDPTGPSEFNPPPRSAEEGDRAGFFIREAMRAFDSGGYTGARRPLFTSALTPFTAALRGFMGGSGAAWATPTTY